MEYNNTRAQYDLDQVEWLDELVHSNKEDAAGSEAEQILAYTPCLEDDPDYCGTYTSNDGQSLCYVKEIKVSADAGSGKEEAVACAFLEWAYTNRWFNKDDDLWCHTFEMGTSISDKSYRENYMKTTSELYQIYKSQNK